MMKRKILILCMFILSLSLMGCLNPFAKVGEKAARENRKNVDYLSEKLTGYYKKDLEKEVLNQDDFNDRMIPITEAQLLAEKMEASYKK